VGWKIGERGVAKQEFAALERPHCSCSCDHGSRLVCLFGHLIHNLHRFPGQMLYQLSEVQEAVNQLHECIEVLKRPTE
jgi:hypothetical protein